MALPQREPPIEIPLGGSLDQATGRLFRGPTALAESLNGDHDKRGYLKKSRGFTRIPLTATTHGATPEQIFCTVGVDAYGELVLMGRDFLYTVGAPDTDIDGAALILRGPACVGNVSTGVVHVAPISEG
jgi:hypothetical protein